jgi:hypothetical protein
MKARVREIQEQLKLKEDDIVRGATLYCARNEIQFDRKQQTVLRVAMRKFYKDGVAPLMRDIYEANIKIYPCEEHPK